MPLEHNGTTRCNLLGGLKREKNRELFGKVEFVFHTDPMNLIGQFVRYNSKFGKDNDESPKRPHEATCKISFGQLWKITSQYYISLAR